MSRTAEVLMPWTYGAPNQSEPVKKGGGKWTDEDIRKHNLIMAEIKKYDPRLYFHLRYARAALALQIEITPGMKSYRSHRAQGSKKK